MLKIFIDQKSYYFLKNLEMFISILCKWYHFEAEHVLHCQETQTAQN